MADYNQNEHHDHIDGRPDWQQNRPNQEPQGEYRNPYNPYPPKPRKPRNGFATAALISGILATLNLCCFAFPTAIIFGVGAVCIALISKKENKISLPARIAVFLGVGAVVFGVAEYFYAIKMFEYIKQPENIAQFNQIFEEAEKMLENQMGLGKTSTH